MAKKELQPAELSYSYQLTGASGTKYIDMAQCASAVSRKLFHQGKCYYLSRLTLQGVGSSTSTPDGAAIVSLATLPDTWVTRNAWVKAKALWNTMNKGVLNDNPSIKGKWADFKVFFDKDHYDNATITSSGPDNNLIPIDFGGTAVKTGEWYMGRYVSPQHDVDPNSGEELAADEYYCHMMGPNAGSAGAYNSVGIINGYETTRARVQVAPDVPTNMQTNWMTELSDLGGQDPELANVLEDANDNPPYDIDEYPGGGTNFIAGVTQSTLRITPSLTSDKDIGFKVPLGLIKVLWANQTGNTLTLTLHYTPGTYKGLMATEVKQ